MSDTLLPPNATTTERAVSDAASRIDSVPVPIATIGDPEQAPAAVLPQLAWARSVDVWDATWSEGTRRQVIAGSPAVHRQKATPGSIEDALTNAGYGAMVEERIGARHYDGSTLFNGVALYGPAGGWAMYSVTIDRPIRNDQVAGVLATLATTGALRSHLHQLDFREAAILYDGAALYDGIYNYGVVTQ